MKMRRHDLAWLRAGAPWRLLQWSASTPSGMDSSGKSLIHEAVQAWQDRALPLVVVRQDCSQTQERLLALTLPSAQGRARVLCAVPVHAIQRVSPPVSLQEAWLHVSAHDQTVLQSFMQQISTLQGVQVGVYGSLAWEVLSAHPYRHEHSDVDLIVDVATPELIPHVLNALTLASDAFSCHLDGELRLPTGEAVAWKELQHVWTSPDAQILVKGEQHVRLLTLRQWVDGH